MLLDAERHVCYVYAGWRLFSRLGVCDYVSLQLFGPSGLVCMIKDDFFGMNTTGQPVFPNGTKFTRTEFRGQVRASTLAKFEKVWKIEKKLDDFAADLSQTVHALQNVQKRSINQVATEDLLLFEHDASVEAVQRSTAAWQSVLASWRAPPSPHVINQVFASFGIGKRARPAPHAEVIYNPKDVPPHLGKYTYLWRPESIKKQNKKRNNSPPNNVTFIH